MRSHLATILAALVLAVGTRPHTIVLCVASGGHFAIEQAAAGCCSHGDLSSHATPAVSYENRCATNCTDTPLSISAAGRATERADSTSTPASALLHASLPTSAILAQRVPALARVSRASHSPPRALRTTVILC